MCETSFAYYGTARFSGKREFHLGTVGAADETEAREQLLRLSRALLDGPDPEIVTVRLGYLAAIDERRKMTRDAVSVTSANT